jgi:hypothetical protein
MTALQQLQEELQAHLLVGDNKIVTQVIRQKPDTIEDRLAVYSDAYHWRLLEVLEIDYAVLRDLLGETDFEQLGFAYLDAHPSHSFSIDQVGRYLSEFLAETTPYSQQPHLSELAALVWALSETIDAADAPILTANDLAAIPQEEWSEMCIGLHPSVQLLACRWNSVALWQALANQQKPPTPKKLAEEMGVVVWRKELQSYYCVLSPQEAWVMQTLQQGISFGEICEGLLQWLPETEVAQYAVNLLLRWVSDGMLSSIKN